MASAEASGSAASSQQLNFEVEALHALAARDEFALGYFYDHVTVDCDDL
jgi:hypothetical protein